MASGSWYLHEVLFFPFSFLFLFLFFFSKGLGFLVRRCLRDPQRYPDFFLEMCSEVLHAIVFALQLSSTTKIVEYLRILFDFPPPSPVTTHVPMFIFSSLVSFQLSSTLKLTIFVVNADLNYRRVLITWLFFLNSKFGPVFVVKDTISFTLTSTTTSQISIFLRCSIWLNSWSCHNAEIM